MKACELLLLGALCFCIMTVGVSAGQATCHDPFFGKCYGILHTCPPACPRLWVHSLGILFKSHSLYLGARRVQKWEESVDNMMIQLDGEEIKVPTGEGQRWWSPDMQLMIRRPVENNKVEVKVEGLFAIVARVVPITAEESQVHGYDVTEDNCYAHLELNFKFYSLSRTVDGVLGQTYRPNYQSRVRMAAAMPIMGGADKFASLDLFATDCAVSKFGLKLRTDSVANEGFDVACGSAHGGRGIVCRR